MKTMIMNLLPERKENESIATYIAALTVSSILKLIAAAIMMSIPVLLTWLVYSIV